MNTISRRSFLKTFSSALTAATFNPSHAIAVNENLYLNRALGIAIKKPPNWVFEKLQKFDELRKSQMLNDSLDPAIESLIFNSAEPLFVFGLDSKDYRFQPSGTFYAEHFELNGHEHINDVITAEDNLYKTILPDYELKNSMSGILISGFESVRLESTFTFKTEKVLPISVRNTTIITHRHPFIYTIRLFDSPINSMDAKKEINLIINDIHYS